MSNKENLLDFLYRNVKRRNWEEVIKKCAEEIEALSMMLTQAKDTTLHLAAYDNNVEVVARLVKLICRSQREEVLKLKNERGNTPLHVAAAMGCARMCHIIGSVDEKLVDERNKDGESPLFLAALHGHKMAFFCLYDFCKMDLNRVRSNCRRKLNGDTILHCALKNEQFDVAFQLINLNNEAATWVDREGYTPLHVLATKPTAFKSGAHIGHLQDIVYHCICVDELKPESAASCRQAKKPTKAMRAASFFPENYATCISLLTNLWNGFLMLITFKTPWEKKKEMNSSPGEYNEAKGLDLEKDADKGTEINETHESNPPLDTQLLKRHDGHQTDRKPPSSIFPQNYDTCINFFQFFFSVIMIILGFGSAKIRKLREKKEKHRWSVQVMEKLLELGAPDKYGQNGDSPMILNLQPGETLPYIVQGYSIGFNEEETYDVTKPDNNPKPNNYQGFDGMRKLGKEKQQKHRWAVELMNKLVESTPPDDTNTEMEIAQVEDGKTISLILVAARYGVVEMVSKLFKDFPELIRYSDSDGKNVVLLAAEYRQTEVYKFLLHKKKLIQTLFRASDKYGNTALHLAANVGDHNKKTWRVTGPALQLQSEIKWYQLVEDSMENKSFYDNQFVEDSMKNKSFVQYNNDGELAENIFNKTHQDLLKSGQEWLVRTSESCSLLAALITTVAFASATTVPGGNGDNGTPPLEWETGFFIFALSSLIALCLSTTSVVAFLSILSSKFEMQDFVWKLPLRLLIGLSSLFFSIVAMLVSFCAGHYFMLSHRLQNMVVIAYVAASLPIALFFAVVQIHLHYDLLVGILSKLPT